jgi:hypothetical protein
VIALSGLSGCAAGTSATDSFCQAYLPVTYSVSQTPVDVQQQIDANNGAYECACNHDCPEPQP